MSVLTTKNGGSAVDSFIILVVLTCILKDNINSKKLTWEENIIHDAYIYKNGSMINNHGAKELTYALQRSIKLTKTVFFVPSRRTCGGLITVLRLSPASSGLFSLRI